MAKSRVTPSPVLLGVLLLVAGIVCSVYYVGALARHLPSGAQAARALDKRSLALATELVDRHGARIGALAEERRYYVSIDEIPKHVRAAFVSIEDRGFYGHVGVSPTGMLRAAWANLRGQAARQGGSTITQQLARLYFLDNGKNLSRKLREAMLALAIERRLTKDQILELYLNKIFLGNGSYGIEAAARNYFHKSVGDLTISEAAMLAALPKAPSHYAPHRHLERALKRSRLVLKRMAIDRVITKSQFLEASKNPPRIRPRARDLDNPAGYFIAEVQREMSKRFESRDLTTNGLQIVTTLDHKMQDNAATATRNVLRRIQAAAFVEHERVPTVEGGLISIDVKTGAVLALQGGGEFSKSQFNRVNLARRPIGPLVLPLMAAVAFGQGYHLASPVEPMTDTRSVDFDTPSDLALADLTIYDAITSGDPALAAALLAKVGTGTFLDFSRTSGFSFDTKDMSLALGEGRASPWEIARAFSAFAAGGIAHSPYLIDRLVSSESEPTTAIGSFRGRATLTPQTAFIVTNVLQHTARFGEHSDLRVDGIDHAGIGGASQDLHNAWYVGYTPSILTVVWIGAEFGDLRLGKTNAQAAKWARELWRQYMARAPQEYLTSTPFPVPAGISFGRLAAHGSFPGTAEYHTVPFVTGQEPKAAEPRVARSYP